MGHKFLNLCYCIRLNCSMIRAGLDQQGTMDMWPPQLCTSEEEGVQDGEWSGPEEWPLDSSVTIALGQEPLGRGNSTEQSWNGSPDRTDIGTIQNLLLFLFFIFSVRSVWWRGGQVILVCYSGSLSPFLPVVHLVWVWWQVVLMSSGSVSGQC